MENTVGTLLRNLDGPVLVTGHTGFKGTWLVRYLKQFEVQTIGFSLPPEVDSLYSRSGLKGEINEEFGDICDIEKFSNFVLENKPSAIFHLAAQALVSESYLDPIGTFKTNVIGTANVLEVGKSLPGLKAVGVVTTDKVYKNLNEGKKFKEGDSILGTDPYSASKAACENVIEAWRKIPSKHQEFPIVSLRAGNVIGGGDLSSNRLIPDLVRSFQTDNKVVIRNPLSTRPWQHVLDPLTGYLLAMEHAIATNSNSTYNFGPQEPSLTVSEVVHYFRNRWKELEVHVSDDENSNYESELLDLDSSHAHHTLKWTPVLDQYASIQSTIEWWEDHLLRKRPTIECIDNQIRSFIEKSNFCY
jgi:CDP-glucose 4,6-dehydratase